MKLWVSYASLIILVVLFGAITWTLGRGLDLRSHIAKTNWIDVCKDGVQETSGPATEENTSCDVTHIIKGWIPKLDITFKEAAKSLNDAYDKFSESHGGSGHVHNTCNVSIEELKVPTCSITLNTKTEKIISTYYSSLMKLAAYLNVFNSNEWIYMTNLSEAIKGIRRALCNMKMLAESLALNETNIIRETWNFSRSLQTNSYTELMNLNETVLTQGKEILDNLTQTFMFYVDSSLKNCELKCHKKRKLVCKTKGQKKEKGKNKGQKHRSKKQPKNRKGKGKNRSS